MFEGGGRGGLKLFLLSNKEGGVGDMKLLAFLASHHFVRERGVSSIYHNILL